LNTSNLIPADFPIDQHGRIVEVYYGGDAGDRIPIERVKQSLHRGQYRRTA
jgi:peroxiredoxin Q/BCP